MTSQRGDLRTVGDKRRALLKVILSLKEPTVPVPIHMHEIFLSGLQALVVIHRLPA